MGVNDRTTEITGKMANKIIFSLFYLNDEGWTYAMGLMSEINLHSGDAVHLATAIEARCDVLITNDSHFKRNAKGKMSIMLPEDFLKSFLKNKQILTVKSGLHIHLNFLCMATVTNACLIG